MVNELNQGISATDGRRAGGGGPFAASASPSGDDLLRQFADPPAEYGLYPCWWWEGERVNKEKLTWQLEEMKKVGTFATFFYLRCSEDEPFALVPAYGSDEYLDLFRHSLEEHRRLGMQAYFSEWTGQRSVADQILSDPVAHMALAGQRLVLHERETTSAGVVRLKIPADEDVLSAAAYRVRGGSLAQGSRQDLRERFEGGWLRWEAPDSGWLVAVVTSQTHGLDFLNHGVADRWVENLWRPYLEKMPEFVGSTFRGYVQDELDVLSGDILYSPALLDRFIAEKGYDPRPLLVGLFHDIGRRTDKIRCGYYDVMCGLLEESIYARLSRWHEDRNMAYGTIAVRGRQDMLAQTSNFGDLFRLLRWYHFPGNEDPQLDPTIPRRRRFIDAKLSSSAAHIFERRRAGMCVYWGAGWGVTLEQRMAWTNENYAYGLNLYDPHMAQYSLVGGWYEWVPPAQYFYQPHWKHYRAYSDYVRRLSYMMSQGTHAADVAILFPTTSIHANWLRGDRYTLEADITASTTYDMAARIYAGGVDFDFVDDETLCRADVRGGTLNVAGLAFRVVILPPMTTIRTRVLEKLREFYESGGVVLAYQRLPGASAENGRDDPQLRTSLEAIFGVPSSDGLTHSVSGVAHLHEDFFSSGILARRSAAGGTALLVPGEQNSGTNASVYDLATVISRTITLDVCAADEDLYHTHQRVGDRDVYFLYNTRPAARTLTVTFRVAGEPDICDAMTGEVSPCCRFERQGPMTTVRLKMERHEGVILSFAPPAGRPAVVEDNLDEVTSAVPGQVCVAVHGTCAGGGMKRVRVRCGEHEYVGEVRLDGPPDPILLGGEWGFRLRPTMDNRWGDYRYPASPDFIGAEARRFRYMEEDECSGTALGWHEPDLSDASWPRYTFSHGPYWYTAGPFREGEEPPGLLEEVLTGETDLTVEWRRCDFSRLYGHESKEVHQHWGGVMGVSDCFFVFDELAGGRDATRYLFTTVLAEETGEWDLVVGGEGAFAFRAWLNGQDVLSAAGPELEDRARAEPDPGTRLLPGFMQAPPGQRGAGMAEARVTVQLKQGPNTVLLRLVQPLGRQIRAYAAFVPPGTDPSAGKPPIPRLRWFIEATGLVHDILPEADRRVVWYRFEAPPGTRAITLQLDAVDAEAWVDGEPVEMRDHRIELGSPKEGVSQVALRVRQKPGCYAGAALPEPVAFECEQGRVPLGDWCDHALESYSGGVVYSRQFTLEPRHLTGRVLLDLGRVSTTAEVRVNGRAAGVGLARPFRFDVTGLVREGTNDLEVTVYNTLANHYAVGLPSRFVYEGQTVSGLLGPVTVQFLAEVTVRAWPVG